MALRSFLFVSALCGARASAAAEVFTLTSPAFADNGLMAAEHAGNAADNPNCTGKNVAPGLDWSNAPAGTRSFVLVIYDPQGRNGLGITHQIAYGIPVATRHFNEGDLDDPAKGFVGGRSTPGAEGYYGPCPMPGSGLHHYVFTIIATDMEPNAMQPGLSREEVFTRLAGHARGVAAIVGRFGQ